jgi:hypothetical protein
MREALQDSRNATAVSHGTEVFILALPVPLLDRPQRLGVEFNFTADSSGEVAIFKEVVKMI